MVTPVANFPRHWRNFFMSSIAQPARLDISLIFINILIINILTKAFDFAMQAFSHSLPMMLYRTLDAVMPRFRQIFSEFGLTEQQWRVLRVLWQHEQIAFRELADLTLIPPPSLVGVVDRLTKSGLARRRRSISDRRNVFVRRPARGRRWRQK